MKAHSTREKLSVPKIEYSNETHHSGLRERETETERKKRAKDQR